MNKKDKHINSSIYAMVGVDGWVLGVLQVIDKFKILTD